MKKEMTLDEKFDRLVEYSMRSGRIDVGLYAEYDV